MTDRSEIASALERVPDAQRDWMTFLVAHLPERDAATLDAEFLLETCAYAARVRNEVPCSMEVPEDVFREYVLPHAHLDERRDRWRPLLYRRFAETARRAASIEDAVRTLNRVVFEELEVTYHPTKRPHDNMSPCESIEWGFASCSGLSILLASACRAVGIPARVVGTPMWADGTGNHNWVEVWDHGTWRFLGASEPGPYDLTWFNDRARAPEMANDGHGVFAARYSPGETSFPLFWSPADRSVRADDVTERYLAVQPTPRSATDIVVEPRRYLCHRVERPIALTGRLDDPQWAAVPWTRDFVDIEGHKKPTPRFHTRAKLCWDDTYLYVGALLEDPHVWGTLTEHNSIVFNDPDFEVFIDPDGDNHGYYEFEVNALGTIWELTLDRPYRDGGPVHRGDNMPGLRHAVHVDGTLNDPADEDVGWTVEIAFPWEGLARYAGSMPCPPGAGDTWRMNFSRVHWLTDVAGDTFRKVPRDAHAEDNWVWSPQEAIDMHRPERWGYVTFTTDPPGTPAAPPPRDPTWPARERLMDLYYQQRAREQPLLDASGFEFRGVPDSSLGELRVSGTDEGWRAELDVVDDDGRIAHTVSVDHEGRLTERR